MDGLTINISWEYFLGIMGALIAIASYTNGRFTALGTYIGWLNETISELSIKAENVTAKLFRNGAPVSLTPGGYHVLARRGLRSFVDAHRRTLLATLDANRLSDGYEIQRRAFTCRTEDSTHPCRAEDREHGAKNRRGSDQVRVGFQLDDAHRQLQEYGERSRAALAAAESKYQEAVQAVKDTHAVVAAKETHAAAIERQALTPLNSTVLNKLIATDAGAWWKFWSAFGLIMGLELLPLSSKLLAPQTVAGIRIATDRVISVAHHMRRRMAAIDEEEVEEALRSSMASAMRAAIAGPELQRFAARVFAAKVAALVPMEVFKALMREIEVRDYDIQSFCRRHPSHARILTAEWQKTVDETIEMLRRTRPEAASAWWAAQQAA